MIVKAAVECSLQINTVVVGDDTDLLVLLCYYCEFSSQDVFFQPEPKANTANHRVWDLRKTKTVLGVKVIEVILFVHAVLGCYTKSRLHGLRKGKPQHLRWLQRMNSSCVLHICFVVMQKFQTKLLSRQEKMF